MQAIVNVDALNTCFMYAVLSMLNYNDAYRKLRTIVDLNFGNIDASYVYFKGDVLEFEN